MVKPQGIDNTQLTELAKFAEHLAELARQAILPHFRTPLEVQLKADRSPVTSIDRNAEKRIRSAIAARYPGHGIIGEEYGTSQGDGNFTWVIDPIDGTKNFLCGVPLFGSLICLLAGQTPIVGIIDLPGLGERWRGAINYPTVKDGNPCHTSDCKSIRNARVGATSIDLFEGVDLDKFNRVSTAARFRIFGGDCSLYAGLASGNIDLVVEADLNSYDFFALIPVVEGAGGVITDWRGDKLDMQSDGKVIAAATHELHSETVKILSK